MSSWLQGSLLKNKDSHFPVSETVNEGAAKDDNTSDVSSSPPISEVGVSEDEDANEQERQLLRIIEVCSANPTAWPPSLLTREQLRSISQPLSDADPTNILDLILKPYARDMAPLELLLRYISKRHTSLLARLGHAGPSPLHKAVRARSSRFIKHVCRHITEATDWVLGQPDAMGDTCLHLAVGSDRLDGAAIFEMLLQHVFHGDILSAINIDGLSILHLAVEYDKCTEAQVDVVKSLLRMNGDTMDGYPSKDHGVVGKSLSVYQHHLQSRRTYAETVDRSSRGEGVDFRFFRSLKHLSLSNHASCGARHHRSVGPPSVDPEGSAQSLLDGSNAKPSQMGTFVLSTTPSPGAADEIAFILKLHYMMSRHDLENIRAFLYEEGQGKELYWSLQGCPSTIDCTILQTMSSHVDFDDTLQFVDIPSLTVANPTSSTMGTVHRKAIGASASGRRDYVVLFHWLRARGVKNIVDLFVDDHFQKPHGDEAIVDTLAGLRILRIWDWARNDISSTVICKAAPDVQELVLYWGGDDMVLREWGETAGIIALTCLRKVTVKYHRTRLNGEHDDANLQVFREHLVRSRQDQQRSEQRLPDLEIEIIREALAKQHGDIETCEATQRKPVRDSNAWLACMDDFNDFIAPVASIPVKASTSIEPVTIAIIDDGVDVTHPSLQGQIIGGRSFCRENGRSLPYWSSRQSHGTTRANLICRICPAAKLYVIRLDGQLGRHGTRHVDAWSAAQAVRAAIARGVDMISISWTISKIDARDNKAAVAELDSALRDATKARILILCAAGDVGTMNEDESHPELARPQRLRIGAATQQGRCWKWLRPEHVHYFFPGVKITSQRPDSHRPESPARVSGSGAATAVAAGFVALMLHVVALVAVHDNGQGIVGSVSRSYSGIAPRQVRQLLHGERMDAMFRNVRGTIESEGKYLQVWNKFGNLPDPRGTITNEKRWEVLQDLVIQLLGDISFNA